MAGGKGKSTGGKAGPKEAAGKSQKSASAKAGLQVCSLDLTYLCVVSDSLVHRSEFTRSGSSSRSLLQLKLDNHADMGQDASTDAPVLYPITAQLASSDDTNADNQFSHSSPVVVSRGFSRQTHKAKCASAPKVRSLQQSCETFTNTLSCPASTPSPRLPTLGPLLIFLLTFHSRCLRDRCPRVPYR